MASINTQQIIKFFPWPNRDQQKKKKTKHKKMVINKLINIFVAFVEIMPKAHQNN